MGINNGKFDKLTNVSHRCTSTWIIWNPLHGHQLQDNDVRNNDFQHYVH